MHLAPLPPRCYRCKSLESDYKTCTACRRQSSLSSVRPATQYKDVAKDIVWKFKFSGAQSAAKDLASAMAPLLPENPDSIIVYAPTATSHVRKRGYDQARLLAREIAKVSERRCLPALARAGQARQVGATREQRKIQMDSAFRVRMPLLVKDAHIVLVDDVLTTGATLEAAAKTLKAAGAKRIDAIVFAQA